MSKDTAQPRRPYIPPTLYLLACLVVVDRLVLGEGRGWMDGYASRLVAVVAAVLLVGALVGSVFRAPWAPLCFALAVTMASAVVSASCVLDRGDRFVEAMSHGSVSSWNLRIVTDPIQRNDVYRCRALAFCEQTASGEVWLSLPQPRDIGDVVRCVGSFVPNAEDDWGVSSRQQGVWGSVRAVRLLTTRKEGGAMGLIRAMRRRVLSMIRPEESEERALVAGCLCGYKTGLAAFGLDDLFSRCGLAHLVAVSGSHLAVFASIVTEALVSLRMRPRTRVAVMCGCCGTFVLLCGAPPSAVRALIMQVAALLGGLAGRRSHALTAVSVAGTLMVALDPAVSGQLGFLLSVSAVAGLCVFSAYASYAIKMFVGSHKLPRWMPKKTSLAVVRLLNGLRDSLAASLVAQLVTLPLVAQAYGEVSLIGPLMSALVGVPFSALLGLSLASVALGWVPLLGGIIAHVTRAFSWAILAVVRACGSFSLASIPIPNADVVGLAACVGMVALLLVWPKVSGAKLRIAVGAACVLACVVLARWRYFAPPRICVLDVGQGDAILVQQGAHAMLVDAGPGDAVAEALARCHVLHLDAAIITHLHADHYEGLSALVGRMACDQVYVAKGVKPNIPNDIAADWRELTGKDPEEVAWGDVVNVGDFSMRVVWPEQPVAGDVNADSLEMLVSYDKDGRKLTALLTGDAEHLETGAVVDKGAVGDIDVLKVGHHGSSISIDERDAEALDPEVAVASAGEGNSYGHPDPTCVETLRKAGARFYCTKDVGDVEVTPGIEGPAVRVAHDTS